MTGIAQRGAHAVLIGEIQIASAASCVHDPTTRFESIGQSFRRISKAKDEHLFHRWHI